MKRMWLYFVCFIPGCILSASAAEVSLTADDASGLTSFNAAGNWSDGLAPSAGTTYRVDGKTLRTPATVSQSIVFAGDSLTLASNASLLLIKSPELNQLVCPNLIMQDASMRTMDSNIFMGGMITIQGTPSAPSRFCGGDGVQNLYQSAELRGDGVVLVNRSDSGAADYTLRLRGNNANFSGRFIVDGAGSGKLRLGLGHVNNLGGTHSGTEALVTLKNNGGLFADATHFQFTDPTWWIDVQNNGMLSASGAGPRTLTITTPIRGTGVLTISDNGIVILNGLIEGISAIAYEGGGTLGLGSGFAFAGPVAANKVILSQPAIVSNTLSVASGALGYTIPSNGAAPTLTVQQGFSTGTGTLSLTVDTSTYALDKDQKIPLLKAQGIATQFPLASISYIVADSLSGLMQYQLIYESDSGLDVLTLQSLTPPPVYLIGADSSGSSFNTGTYWSNALAPGAGTNYVVRGSGKLLRCRAAGTFAGNSLTVADLGDFAINTGPARVNNLRLGSAGILTVRAQGEQVLRGTNDVFAITAQPFQFQIEDNDGIHKEKRALKVESVFKGSGDIVFRCYSTSTSGGRYTLAALSPLFTGGVAVQQDGVYLCFSDQLCLGGAAASFRADRFTIRDSAVVRFLNSMTLDDPTRGITVTGTGYLQLTNQNQVVIIKNPIAGGTLIKGGRAGLTNVSDPGTLVLDATNTYAKTVLQAGTIEVRNAEALGAGALEFYNGCTLRIAAATGVKLKSATPLVKQGSEKLRVIPYGAPEGNTPWPAFYEGNLFILTATNNIDSTLITLPIPGSHKVSILTRSMAEGTQVYVVAKLNGTILMIQ